MYDDEEERDQEPREVQTLTIYPPAPCWLCGRPEQGHVCFRCGRPVCYNQENYFSDSSCGGWILDTWHNEHPDGNEFYCKVCLHAGLIPTDGLTLINTGIKIKAENGTIELVIGGETHELDSEQAADLIAYLFDERGELFGKPYEEGPEQEQAPELVTVTSESSDQGGQDQDDSLGDLEDHPF